MLNRGNESRPKNDNNSRDLNAVESYETALKIAQVNLQVIFQFECVLIVFLFSGQH